MYGSNESARRRWQSSVPRKPPISPRIASFGGSSCSNCRSASSASETSDTSYPHRVSVLLNDPSPELISTFTGLASSSYWLMLPGLFACVSPPCFAMILIAAPPFAPPSLSSPPGCRLLLSLAADSYPIPDRFQFPRHHGPA